MATSTKNLSKVSGRMIFLLPFAMFYPIWSTVLIKMIRAFC